ncbi:AMP-binding protein [Burkholderiaceae bacterium DAT-1]|nr:AMP-binding protein [Burkholderiaceae bacterium DAT-1]
MPWLDHLIDGMKQLPDSIMLEVLGGSGPARQYSRGQVLHASGVLAKALLDLPRTDARPLKIGIVMQNSPEWIVADLALLCSGAVEVPVPLAFSADQAMHLLDEVELCLVDERGAARMQQWQTDLSWPAPPMTSVTVDALLRAPRVEPVIQARPADDVVKVIHTSGTTSRPKGVRIRHAGLDALLSGLRTRIPAGTYTRYLSLVPLSLLIEQVTAAYLTFMEGGTLIFTPADLPLLGEHGGTTAAMLTLLPEARPAALTLPPSMVEAMLAACRMQPEEPTGVRCMRIFGCPTPAFIACGGAPTAPAVIDALAGFGIPVYEGYGLSENSSVVAWNAPGICKAGTVGKPLDHVQVRLATDGELLVKSSSLFAGYAGSDPSSCEVDADGWLHTGDLAEIDPKGYLRIFGRKKNLIITANGRNVSPEWVESRYKSLDCVEQAVLFGDGLDQLTAFLVLAPGYSNSAALADIRAFADRHLSSVERADRVVTVSSRREIYAEFFTVTGRPRREQIWALIQHNTTHPSQEETCLAL